MVTHLVSWKFRADIPAEDRIRIGKELSEAFPALVGKIPGLLKVRFFAPPLASSTCDMALYCELEKESDIAVYAQHPEHLKVAAVVRANCEGRCAVDFPAEEER